LDGQQILTERKKGYLNRIKFCGTIQYMAP